MKMDMGGAAAVIGFFSAVRAVAGHGTHGGEEPDHRGSAAHVHLHGHHAVGGLDGEAAGIEGDALADEGQRATGVGRVIGELDESGSWSEPRFTPSRPPRPRSAISAGPSTVTARFGPRGDVTATSASRRE